MNLEAETGTLSALLNIPDFAVTLPFKLKETDFEDAGARIIAYVVLKLVNEGIEKPSKKVILSTVKDLGLADFNSLTNDGELLERVLQHKPTNEEGLTYVRVLKKNSLVKNAVNNINNLKDYLENTNDKFSEIITKCEDTVFKLTTESDGNESVTVKLSDKLKDHINKLGDNPGELGLDIGFPEWQERIGGISNSKLHMIIAHMKTGKSTIGLRAAMLLSKFIPVLFVDTEMTEAEQLTRMQGMISKIPYNIIDKGYWKNPNHEHYKYYNRMLQAADDGSKLNWHYISANGKSVGDMIPAMRRWVIQNKCAGVGKVSNCLIIYDYLKLPAEEQLSQHRQEYQFLGLEASRLKNFAAKYSVPIITFGQTNRADDSSINCLASSKRLGEIADSVTLFKEKDEIIKTKDPIGSHLLRIFVTRHGAATIFGEHIRLDFDKAIGHMQELGLFKPSAEVIEKNKRPFKKATNDATVDEIMESNFGD